MSTTRRTFLRYGSTAAAGFAVAAMSQSRLFADTRVRVPSLLPLLSVGYAVALPATSGRLINANSLLMPDPSFLSRDVRICIHGGSRADQYLKTSGGMAVDPIGPTGDSVCFWTGKRYGTTVRGKLVLPISSTSGLSFSVKNLAAKTESILTLGLLSNSDPKLQGGVYVIALRESASDAAPNWNNLELVRQGNVYVIPNAPFSYAILSIDYAK